MYIASSYVRAESLDEAWELNQKRNNKIMGGNCWLRMGKNNNINTIISLSKLGLDKIEETDSEFKIGAMVTLRQIENNESLNKFFDNTIKEAVESIVGVQFRNMATVGGSIWGRFGFSDVLTIMLALGAKVELHKTGIVPIEEFIDMEHNNDILVAVIVPKNNLKVAYDTVRLSKTDFPLLTCAVSVIEDKMRVVIGARPTKARFFDCNSNTETDEVCCKFNFGTNMRATAEYREQVAKVLVNRCRKVVQ